MAYGDHLGGLLIQNRRFLTLAFFRQLRGSRSPTHVQVRIYGFLVAQLMGVDSFEYRSVITVIRDYGGQE